MIRGSLPPTVEPAAASLTPMRATGLLVLTFSGGLIGYRQANSALLIRAESAARFLR
jgi:hypothetical protein